VKKFVEQKGVMQPHQHKYQKKHQWQEYPSKSGVMGDHKQKGRKHQKREGKGRNRGRH